MRVGAKPVLAQPGEQLELALELEALPRADPVDPDGERAVGGDRRVLLPERPRGGVAGVRRELLACAGQPLVQRLEARDRQVRLATHLEQRRQPVSEHAERDRSDRPQVDGHVLSLDAVAARGAADEHAVLVGEVDRQPVDLRLEHVRDGLVRAEALADVVRPLLERLGGRHLLERPHRRRMRDLLEALRRRGAYPLRRRVGRDELGVRPLERSKLVVEGVVGRVGQLGIVENVVAVRVVRDERRGARSRARQGQTSPRISSGCWTRASGSSARSRSSG